MSLPDDAFACTGTRSGPSRKDVAPPSAIAIGDAAVAVVRWCAGNHVADMHDGAANTMHDVVPVSAWPNCMVQ